MRGFSERLLLDALRIGLDGYLCGAGNCVWDMGGVVMQMTFELTAKEIAQGLGEYLAIQNPILAGRECQVTLTSNSEEGITEAKLVFGEKTSKKGGGDAD